MSQDMHAQHHKPAPDTLTGAAQEADKEFKSVGRRVHNEITYRGVDFLLNSIIGVGFTYWTKRTASGEKYWTKPVTGFFEKALKPMFSSPAALKEGAGWGAMFTSIIVGGTTIIAPMVMLEKKSNKKAIITRINERVHGEDVVQNDPRFAEELKEIDHEPRKNFAVGMAARIIVLAPMIAATVTPSINKNMLKYLYNPIASFSKGACKTLGIQPRGLMTRGAMELAEGDLNKAPSFLSDWDFIHRTIGFDFGLTFIYSFAHEATIKTLAAIGFKSTQEKSPGADAPLLPMHTETDNREKTARKNTQGGRVPQTAASVTEFVHRPEAMAAEVAL